MNIPFDNTLFLVPSTTGIVFILAGYIMVKFPPKKINPLYGDRTTRSMKNQERWDFSQKYSAIEMIKLGAILALCSLIGLVYTPGVNTGMFISLGLLLTMVLLLFIRVERAIKHKFGNEE